MSDKSNVCALPAELHCLLSSGRNRTCDLILRREVTLVYAIAFLFLMRGTSVLSIFLTGSNSKLHHLKILFNYLASSLSAGRGSLIASLGEIATY